MEDQRPQNGFFQANTQLADFRYWAKMPKWTEQEAAATLLGVNPNYVFPGALSGRTAPYKSQLDGLLEPARRAAIYDQVGKSHTPADWVEWARRFEYPLPEALALEVEKWGTASTHEATVARLKAEIEALTEQSRQSEKASPTPQNLNLRERDTILRILIGMAMGKYRYNPKAVRNETTQTIVWDVEKVGLSISPDTVLKYLREAAGLLPSGRDAEVQKRR